MSLYLPDQKLGTHSQPGSSSHKFVLKGRQAGSMHRGHTWVFRAETYDTMLAWYEDVKNLTEKTGEERNAFVRRHARSLSQSSARSVSSDGIEEDDADQVPFSANQSIKNQAVREEPPQRPSPGGRFPSDLQVERNLRPLSPSSGSSEVGNDLTTASGGLQNDYSYPTQPTTYDTAQQQEYTQVHPVSDNAYAYDTHAANVYQQPQYQQQSQYQQQPHEQQQVGSQPQTQQYPQFTSSNYQPSATQAAAPIGYQAIPSDAPMAAQPTHTSNIRPVERHESTYGDWMAPAAGGAAAGALGAATYQHYQHYQELKAGAQPPLDPAHNGQINDTTPIPTSTPGYAPISSEPDSLATTPATTADKSFLDRAEVVPAAASSKAANGGPVVYETGRAFPIMRHNTDISVSDLHVPGEYPKVPGG